MFHLTIKASNGVAPDATQAFTLTVSAAPTITSADHTTFTVGSAGSFTVTTTAGQPATTTITETGALPSGVSFTDNGDGTATLAGTPAAGTGGSYSLTIKASNGVGTDPTQAFTLTVDEPTDDQQRRPRHLPTRVAGQLHRHHRRRVPDAAGADRDRRTAARHDLHRQR